MEEGERRPGPVGEPVAPRPGKVLRPVVGMPQHVDDEVVLVPIQPRLRLVCQLSDPTRAVLSLRTQALNRLTVTLTRNPSTIAQGILGLWQKPQRDESMAGLGAGRGATTVVSWAQPMRPDADNQSDDQ